MDNFNLQKFVKKSKNEFYTNLYEGKKEHSMEEKMHDEDHEMEEKMHNKDHKMEENHQSLDPEVADRIEGLLNIPMKAKFLSAGVDLINDFLEDEAMDVEDVVSHLANELEKEYRTAGDHDTAVALDEEEEDAEEEMDVEIEDEVPEMDLDLDTSTDEPDNKEVFSQLVDAYESAKQLGDEKLTRQLANTITYFNKTIIFGDEE
jgi:hypothetical protein